MFMAAAHREMMVGELATAKAGATQSDAARRSAAVSLEPALGKGYGFTVPEGAGKVQWEALQQRRDEYVKKLNKNYTAGWQKEGRGVTV